MGRDYPELANHMLVAVTEQRTKEEIDTLVKELGDYPCIIKTNALIFELSTPGRIGYSLPEMDVPEVRSERASARRLSFVRKSQNFQKYQSLILCAIIQRYQDEIMEWTQAFIH